MTHTEIRQKYLDFMESKGHTIVPSASLIPEDSTTLFTTAGMQSMIPYLRGEKSPHGTRVANSQKCFRAEDIEEVGDNRHTTFFEMLGNWSFGDYFTQQQLPWIFEFLTKEVGLDPKKLFVTVFAGNDQIPRDTESVEIWKSLFGSEAKDLENAETEGMRDGKIFYYGEKKNWWSRAGTPEKMPVGEIGGPDSEIFYQFKDVHTPEFGKVCHVNCDCGTYLEIGNSVFIQYIKNKDGGFDELPNKNVDFGGGLERITAASEDQSDVFLTSAFEEIIKNIESIDNNLGFYKLKPETQKVFRVIADHIKAATFLIADGVIPSNKEAGYVVRRLIRRAVRYGRQLLDIRKPFLAEISETIINMYKDQYPELKNGVMEVTITQAISAEEDKFYTTLNNGLREIEKYPLLDSKIAFKLYESSGFPFELTEEIARERGQQVNYGEFKEEFKKHQEKSRAGAEKKFGGHGLLLDTGELRAANEEELAKVTRLHTATHLLQAALRRVLGDSVTQAGSDITAERLRFDFTFPRKLTPEEIKKTEDLVNEVVTKDFTVNKETLPYDEAVKTGALHFFKIKYPPMVDVYTVGGGDEWFSKEFCGGPHVQHTGAIGHFKITKEEATSAGVRRIKATID